MSCPLVSRIINIPFVLVIMWFFEYPTFEAQNPKDNCNALWNLLKGVVPAGSDKGYGFGLIWYLLERKFAIYNNLHFQILISRVRTGRRDP